MFVRTVVDINTTTRAKNYLKEVGVQSFVDEDFLEKANDILRGNPPVEDPLPGFNIPAQIIIHARENGNRIEMFRLILGEMKDGPLEYDVLDISSKYDPAKYLHPSTLFLVCSFFLKTLS